MSFIKNKTGLSELFIDRVLRNVQDYIPILSSNDKNRAENAVNNRIRQELVKWVQEKKYKDSDVRIDDIAKDMNVSPLQLVHYFRTVLGVRFSQWRKKIRIQEAKELLDSHPSTPACEIGAMVGFEDKSNFRRAFKEICGCSPQEWRQRNDNFYEK